MLGYPVNRNDAEISEIFSSLTNQRKGISVYYSKTKTDHLARVLPLSRQMRTIFNQNQARTPVDVVMSRCAGTSTAMLHQYHLPKGKTCRLF